MIQTIALCEKRKWEKNSEIAEYSTVKPIDNSFSFVGHFGINHRSNKCAGPTVPQMKTVASTQLSQLFPHPLFIKVGFNKML